MYGKIGYFLTGYFFKSTRQPHFYLKMEYCSHDSVWSEYSKYLTSCSISTAIGLLHEFITTNL